MPQTVKIINPRPIKTQGILKEVDAPNTSASGVGVASLNGSFPVPPIARLELGSLVGVGFSFSGFKLLTGVPVGPLGVVGVGVLVGVDEAAGDNI